MNNSYILIIVVLNILQLYGKKKNSISDRSVSKGPIGKCVGVFFGFVFFLLLIFGRLM